MTNETSPIAETVSTAKIGFKDVLSCLFLVVVVVTVAVVLVIAPDSVWR